jgi:hypothetical protein
MFHIKFAVYMFMSYIRIKFHMPSFDGSLVIANKPKIKGNVCMAAMFLFYIVHKYCLNKICIFSKIY